MSVGLLRVLVLLGVALVVAAPALVSSFSITLLNYIGIYGLVALGLVLMSGIGGIVSFGQAAFVGVAAYATAWVTTHWAVSAWVGLVFSLFLTGAFAWALGALTLRLKGHYLSLSTLAWGMAIFFLFGNLDMLGNFNGIGGLPPVTIGTVGLGGTVRMYYLIWTVLLVAMLLCGNLLASRAGRAIRVLRGGNALAESLGIDGFRTRLGVFVLAALLAALSGWLYAHLGRFVSPAPFNAEMGIEYLMMSMIGGGAQLAGGLAGAAIVTLVKNSVQDYLPMIFPQAAGQLESIAFSVLFLVVLQRARGGVLAYAARLLPAIRQPVPGTAPLLARRAQPPPGEALLQVEGVIRRFGGLVAVNKVSFEVQSGEILGLIGPNGAGKSTMFNLLTGALRVNEGRIRFAGQDVSRWTQRAIARAGIARTFQHVKLRPHMSLLDNVLLGAHMRARGGMVSGALRLHRGAEAQLRHEGMRQLQRVGLADRPFELAGNLPLGRQRVLEIARALAADPVLLVLDEPAAGLRRQEKMALAELLRALRREGLTILLVEHDMEFIMGVVDRIVVMDFGEKICEGEPASVRGDARVQEAYLGGVAA